jgi:hypothetical protein
MSNHKFIHFCDACGKFFMFIKQQQPNGSEGRWYCPECYQPEKSSEPIQ